MLKLARVTDASRKSVYVKKSSLIARAEIIMFARIYA